MIPFKNGGCEIELSVKVPQQMGHVKEAGESLSEEVLLAFRVR